MTPNRRLIVLSTAALAVTLAALACSSGDDSGQSSPSPVRPHNAGTESPAGTATPLPTTQPCADPAACEEQSRDIARRDLAAQLGVDANAVSIVASQATDWPDTCLGVSKPGTACAQVVTSGFKVVLENAGQQYEYHTDKGTRAILVTNAGATPQPTP